MVCSCIETEMLLLAEVMCLEPATNVCVLPKCTPILLSVHQVLKSHVLTCNLGTITSVVLPAVWLIVSSAYKSVSV